VQGKIHQKANKNGFGTCKPDRITVDMEGCKVQGLFKNQLSNKKTLSQQLISMRAAPGADSAGP
jgi:hypothetical protein